MIERHTTPERVLTILHWFTGSITSARRAATAGCYFSINGAMLGSDKGRALVRSLPQDRILTETDSPFTSAGGRKSVPWDVITTAEQLSAELRIASDAMAAFLKENAERVLDFAGVKLTWLKQHSRRNIPT